MTANSHRAQGRVLPAVLAGILLLPTMLWASGPIMEFSLPKDFSYPWGITAGPDGNLWFCEYNRGKIGRVTPQGAIAEFNTSSPPVRITAGPDGNLWYVTYDFDFGDTGIGRISVAGDVTEFPLLVSACDIVAGPDGNLWFTSCSVGANAIGRITTTGAVTTFRLPTGPGHYPDSIAAGPDGNLWFTEPAVPAIGRMTTEGSVTEFPLPTGGGSLVSITAGPDGNLWFAEGEKIGRITTDGDVVEFPVAATALRQGPDGNLWFADSASNKLGRLTIGTDRLDIGVDFAVPTANAGVLGIASGPDGNVWFTESQGNKIGRIDLSAVCTPNSLCLGGRFQVTATWTNGGSSGTATPAPVTPNVGYFWFFSSANAEVFVKILNACPSTGHFGVYVNGLTHLGVTVTVTDRRTGVSRDFVNPIGSPFSLIFDGSTFACP
jgi:streptogramin lyase